MVENDFMDFISKEQLEKIRASVAKKTPKEFKDEIHTRQNPYGQADQDDLSKPGKPQSDQVVSENPSEDIKG